MHSRPGYGGRWTGGDCTLEMSKSGSAALAFSYRLVGLRKGILELKDTASGDASRYKKLRP